MPARSDASDVMWARAVELLDEAERLHRRFFHLATADARPRRGSRRRTSTRTVATS
jgi:hypothetical protein